MKPARRGIQAVVPPAPDVAHDAEQVRGAAGWAYRPEHGGFLDAHRGALDGEGSAAVPGGQVGRCVECGAGAVHHAIGIERIDVHAFHHPTDFDRRIGRRWIRHVLPYHAELARPAADRSRHRRRTHRRDDHQDRDSRSSARSHPRTYEKGIKVPDAEMDAVDITGDAFHPEWNYTIKPRPPTSS